MSRRLYPGWGSGTKPFVATYECYPFAYCGREDAEMGNRVVLPQDALRDITRLKLPFPLFFALNPTKQKVAPSDHPKRVSGKQQIQKRRASKWQQFCSVLEFSSQGDTMFVPHWMFGALRIKEGGLVRVDSVLSIPKGEFCQFEVESTEFFALSQRLGAKAILESALRSYASLAEGSRVLVQHADKSYFLKVMKCKPEPLISVLGNVDLEVDFVPPKDYTPSPAPTPTALSTTGSSSSSRMSSTLESAGGTEASMSFKGSSDESLSSAFERLCTVSDDTHAILEDEKPSRKDEILAHIHESTKGGTVPYGEQRVSFTTVSKGHSLLATPRENALEVASARGSDSADLNAEDEELSPSKKRCVNCKRAIPAAGLHMHEIHCARNLYKCDLCSETVRTSQRLQHNDENHTVYSCENEKCDVKIFEGGQAALDAHMLNECRMRNVKCSYCDETHPLASMEFHELECGAEASICDRGCGEEITRKDSMTHICKVVCAKCGGKVEASALEQHENFECLKGERMCDYCSVSQSVENFEHHRQYCGNRSDACDACGAFVRLSEMKAHHESNCRVGVTAPAKDNASQSSAAARYLEGESEIYSHVRQHERAGSSCDTVPSPSNYDPSSEVTTCPHCGVLCLDLEEFQVHCLTQCKRRNENAVQKPTTRHSNPRHGTAGGGASRVVRAKEGAPRVHRVRPGAILSQPRKHPKASSSHKAADSNRQRAPSSSFRGKSKASKSLRQAHGVAPFCGSEPTQATTSKPALLTRGKSVPFSTMRAAQESTSAKRTRETISAKRNPSTVNKPPMFNSRSTLKAPRNGQRANPSKQRGQDAAKENERSTVNSRRNSRGALTFAAPTLKSNAGGRGRASSRASISKRRRQSFASERPSMLSTWH